MRKVAALAAVVLMLGWAVAQADQIVINMGQPGTKANAINFGEEQSNTGADGMGTGQKAGLGQWHTYPIMLLYAPMPALLTGQTINSATFTVIDNWGGMEIAGAEIRRVDTHTGVSQPYTWTKGNGTWDTRSDAPHSGAGKYLADNVITYALDSDNNIIMKYSGHDWAGVLHDDISTTRTVEEVCTDIIDTQDHFGASQFTTWDVTTLVENWVDGTWLNDGFSIYLMDAYITSLDSDGNPEERWIINLPNGRMVLTITYNEEQVVPEPATMLLVGSGVLGLVGYVRRRRMS